MTTAMVSMNAVVIHWAVAAPTPNSTIRLGRATLMIVSLRITTKAAPTSRAMRRPTRGWSAEVSTVNVSAGVVEAGVVLELKGTRPGRRARRGERSRGSTRDPSGFVPDPSGQGEEELLHPLHVDAVELV